MHWRGRTRREFKPIFGNGKGGVGRGKHRFPHYLSTGGEGGVEDQGDPSQDCQWGTSVFLYVGAGGIQRKNLILCVVDLRTRPSRRIKKKGGAAHSKKKAAVRRLVHA